MVDERVNTFMEACVKAGYDVDNTQDKLVIGKWLEDNFGVKHFADLTKEAQWSAIDKMRKEINAEG